MRMAVKCCERLCEWPFTHTHEWGDWVGVESRLGWNPVGWVVGVEKVGLGITVCCIMLV
jgi:hypothetical protein